VDIQRLFNYFVSSIIL